MRVYGLIPARLHSTRLDRKLLLEETGQPLLQHTWEAACRAHSLVDVIIATDSHEIADTAQRFGAECELTGDHPSGTDRVAEIVRRRCTDADAVVNIQGDEPEIDPDHIDTVVSALAACPTAEMSTLATPIHSADQLHDPSCTKVVTAADGRALYFSRLPIPFSRDQAVETLLADEASPWQLHLGIYAYRRPFLLHLTQQPPSRLERLEKLEQLRALELGGRIQVATVEQSSVGIDTPDDYARFVARYRREAA